MSIRNIAYQYTSILYIYICICICIYKSAPAFWLVGRPEGWVGLVHPPLCGWLAVLKAGWVAPGLLAFWARGAAVPVSWGGCGPVACLPGSFAPPRGGLALVQRACRVAVGLLQGPGRARGVVPGSVSGRPHEGLAWVVRS